MTGIEIAGLVGMVLKLGPAAAATLNAWLDRNPNATAEQIAEQIRNLDASDQGREQAVQRFKDGLTD